MSEADSPFPWGGRDGMKLLYFSSPTNQHESNIKTPRHIKLKEPKLATLALVKL